MKKINFKSTEIIGFMVPFEVTAAQNLSKSDMRRGSERREV